MFVVCHSGGFWGNKRTGKYGSVVDWIDLEKKMLEVSKEMFRTTNFQRETHDIDQQALRAVVYPTVCSKTQTEYNLPRRESEFFEE